MGNSNSGRGGLPREKRREIERLINDGMLKHAEIARRTGVDVSTVRRYRQRMNQEAAAAAAGQQVTEHGTETERCSCGARVLMSVGYCISCHQEKTIFGPRRQARLAEQQKTRRLAA
jgi:hypothetical protein